MSHLGEVLCPPSLPFPPDMQNPPRPQSVPCLSIRLHGNKGGNAPLPNRGWVSLSKPFKRRHKQRRSLLRRAMLLTPPSEGEPILISLGVEITQTSALARPHDCNLPLRGQWPWHKERISGTGCQEKQGVWTSTIDLCVGVYLFVRSSVRLNTFRLVEGGKTGGGGTKQKQHLTISGFPLF